MTALGPVELPFKWVLFGGVFLLSILLQFNASWGLGQQLSPASCDLVGPASPLSLLFTQSHPAGQRNQALPSLEFCWQRSNTQQIWVVHTLHIPKRGLALDQLLRDHLFILEMAFLMGVALGHARQSTQMRRFMVCVWGAWDTWDQSDLWWGWRPHQVHHAYTTDVDTKAQVSIFGCTCYSVYQHKTPLEEDKRKLVPGLSGLLPELLNSLLTLICVLSR